MKIISKYKDYYDYLQGIYGVDEKKILDRTSYKPLIWCPETFEIVFCCKGYKLMTVYDYNLGVEYNQYQDIFEPIKTIEDKIWLKRLNNNKYKNLKCPIILKYWNENVEFPILKNLGFDKIFTPQEAYLALDEFLSYKEPEISKNPTDMNRFEAKGFDKKTSFRKM